MTQLVFASVIYCLLIKMKYALVTIYIVVNPFTSSDECTLAAVVLGLVPLVGLPDICID